MNSSSVKIINTFKKRKLKIESESFFLFNILRKKVILTLKYCTILQLIICIKYLDKNQYTLGCQIDEYTRLFGTKETWRKKQTQRQIKVFNKNLPYSFIWPYSFNWHLRVLQLPITKTLNLIRINFTNGNAIH